MTDALKKNSPAMDKADLEQVETLPTAVDEAAAIPKGTIDPVYEAKARVLNHAVCLPQSLSTVD